MSERYKQSIQPEDLFSRACALLDLTYALGCETGTGELVNRLLRTALEESWDHIARGHRHLLAISQAAHLTLGGTTPVPALLPDDWRDDVLQWWDLWHGTDGAPRGRTAAKPRLSGATALLGQRCVGTTCPGTFDVARLCSDCRRPDVQCGSCLSWIGCGCDLQSAHFAPLRAPRPSFDSLMAASMCGDIDDWLAEFGSDMPYRLCWAGENRGAPHRRRPDSWRCVFCGGDLYDLYDLCHRIQKED